MGKLSGKTALVTGSSRGIGRATAVSLAREGAMVAVHYARNEEAAQETVELIEKDGGRAFTVHAELGMPGDIDQLFHGLEAGLTQHTGQRTLDILVNNAAETSPGTALEEVSTEEFDRTFAVNTKAPFFITQRALGLIPDGGRIINISSGLTGIASPSQTVYVMSKGALEQLSRHFARHLAPRGITVNSVLPGVVDNGHEALKIPELREQLAQVSAYNRLAEPKDVAHVVCFLATDEAAWITGASLDATGGSLLG